jgi:hypothetical protein
MPIYETPMTVWAREHQSYGRALTGKATKAWIRWATANPVEACWWYETNRQPVVETKETGDIRVFMKKMYEIEATLSNLNETVFLGLCDIE